jgi:hypothetical protein
MKNRFRLIVAILLSLTIIFVGCSQQSADKPSTPPSEQKVLKLNEVLTKSVEAMAKNNGYNYNMHLTQDINSQGNKTGTDMNFDIKMTQSPNTQYWKGNIKVSGREVPMEMYLIDNTIYQRIDTNPWTKLTNNNISTSGGAIGNGPVDTMKQVSKIALDVGENKGITMKRENGSYVVTMGATVLENSKEFYNQILKGMASASNGAKTDLSKVKFKDFNQVYYIDEKTFELKSVENRSVMDFPILGQTVIIDQNVKVTVNGRLDGKIEVPADVMK